MNGTTFSESFSEVRATIKFNQHKSHEQINRKMKRDQNEELTE